MSGKAETGHPFHPIPDDPENEWTYLDPHNLLRAYVIHLVTERNWYAPEEAADEIIAVVKGWCDQHWT